MSNNIVIDGHANKTNSTFRMEYSVGINIKAKQDRLWAVMTNAKDFPRWNSTIKSMEGEIALGQTIKLVAKIAPTRTFSLKVIEFVPGKNMTWSDGNFMFKGDRLYTLVPQSDGFTNFTMEEVYTGLMLPMIAGSLPDFRPAFEQYAADLKRESEKA